MKIKNIYQYLSPEIQIVFENLPVWKYLKVHVSLLLTDTGEFAPKWTRVFPTWRWVILVARTRRKKREENTRVHFGVNSPEDKFRVLACVG